MSMEGDITEGSLDGTKAPPAKKSLFSKDVLARASSEAEASQAIAFFSRSHEIFPQRLAEEERRRQKNTAKLERKRSSTGAERKEASPPEEKKRRISTTGSYSSDEDIVGNSRSRRTPTPSRHGSYNQDSTPPRDLQSSPTTLSKSYIEDLRAENKGEPKTRGNAPAIISLSDSDIDDTKENKNAAVKKTAVQPIFLDDDDDNYVAPPTRDDDDLQVSDEEFPELIQRAREREKQKALQRRNTAEASEQQSHAPRKDTTMDDDIFQTTGPMPSNDPIAEILLTSHIEGSKPLMVKRKLSQRLKEVRMIWCERQSFQGQLTSDDLKDMVFLTWRGKRLFDSTTCMALGLGIDPLGRLTADGDGVDDEGRVHLEVWTEELHSSHQKIQAAREREDDLDSEEELSEQKPESSTIRLVFKARDFKDYKLKVKPTTMLENMIESFRQNRKVPDTKEISIYVDGDKLDPSWRVEETELEDMDAVEVHIR